jgi:uncharacterized membrane protein
VEEQQIRRIISALLISAAFSILLLSMDFSIDPRQGKLSKAQTLAVALLTPAEFLTEQGTPGHSGVQIVVLAVWALVLCADVGLGRSLTSNVVASAKMSKS